MPAPDGTVSMAAIAAIRLRNDWAWSDVVSGPLTRYAGVPVRPADTRLRWLGPALASHVRYWGNAEVLDAVRKELATAVPRRP